MTDLKIISKEQAVREELKKYFTGIPCKNGHISERSVSTGKCISCSREGGRRYSLSEHGKANNKEYREKNKKILAAKRKEYIKKPEVILRQKLYNQEYNLNNKEKLAENKKQYRLKNLQKIKRKQKEIYEKNKDIIREKQKEYLKTEKGIAAAARAQQKYRQTEQYKASRRKISNKRNEDPTNKLIQNYRHRVYMLLKSNSYKKESKTKNLLGCDGALLKQHLEKFFTEDMTWENYGKWHVDHIVPCDYFIKNYDFNDLNIQKICFNYLNLQPMWGKENARKRSEVDSSFAKKIIKKIKVQLSI